MTGGCRGPRRAPALDSLLQARAKKEEASNAKNVQSA